MTTNTINSSMADNQSNQQVDVKQSVTNPQADANQAPSSQDRTANAVFDNDLVSSRQVEGLTDTDELGEQMANNAAESGKQQSGKQQSETQQSDKQQPDTEQAYQQQSDKIGKSPEIALNEQGAANQAKSEQDNGQAGSHKIGDAVEHLNEDKLDDHIEAQDDKGTVDIPVPASPD